MNAIIEKAKKLLNLKERAGTPAEAEAAARALSKLIDKYRISIAELEAAGEPAEQCVVDETEPLLQWKRLNLYKRRLCSVLCDHYGVAWWQRAWPAGNNRRGVVWNRAVHLCGRASDIAVLRYMYAWLSAEIERLAAQYGGSRTERRSFKLGFVAGIERQLAAGRKEVEAEHGLVLRSRIHDAKKALYEMFPEMGNAKNREPEIDPLAFIEGRKSGNAMHLGERFEPVGKMKKLEAAAS